MYIGAYAWSRSFDANSSMTCAIEVENVNQSVIVTMTAFVRLANPQGNDATHLVIALSRIMERSATRTVLLMTATGSIRRAMADVRMTAILPPEMNRSAVP